MFLTCHLLIVSARIDEEILLASLVDRERVHPFLNRAVCSGAANRVHYHSACRSLRSNGKVSRPRGCMCCGFRIQSCLANKRRGSFCGRVGRATCNACRIRRLSSRAGQNRRSSSSESAKCEESRRPHIANHNDLQERNAVSRPTLERQQPQHIYCRRQAQCQSCRYGRETQVTGIVYMATRERIGGTALVGSQMLHVLPKGTSTKGARKIAQHAQCCIPCGVTTTFCRGLWRNQGGHDRGRDWRNHRVESSVQPPA